MNLYAIPASAGAAVLLIWDIPSALILATPTSAPPVNPASLSSLERQVVGLGTRTHPAENPFVDSPAPNLEHSRILDFHKSLKNDVWYHLYDINHPSTAPVSLHLNAVQLKPRRTAEIPVVRDFIKDRLEYHLENAVLEGVVHPYSNQIPILEQSTLTRDEPLPCVLYKESWSQTPGSIGREGGAWKRNGETSAVREFRYHYNVRIDLLCISRQPQERLDLAQAVHGAMLMDDTFYMDAGLENPMVSRSMTDGRWNDDGDIEFGESITLEADVIAVVSQTMLYTVNPNLYTAVHVSL
jgi:hypothetical protein